MIFIEIDNKIYEIKYLMKFLLLEHWYLVYDYEF